MAFWTVSNLVAAERNVAMPVAKSACAMKAWSSRRSAVDDRARFSTKASPASIAASALAKTLGPSLAMSHSLKLCREQR